MQNEDYVSYHPSSHGRRRLGRNRSRIVAVTVLFVGLVIGGLAGRWSVSDIHEFKEADPPTPPKDPHKITLDEFEGMWVFSPNFLHLKKKVFLNAFLTQAFVPLFVCFFV